MTPFVPDYAITPSASRHRARRLGRKEIAIARNGRPGLMATRAEYGARSSRSGSTDRGSLHMTNQTAALIEDLKALGADVRWASCNIYSTQDHAAAAIAATGTPVFAIKVRASSTIGITRIESSNGATAAPEPHRMTAATPPCSFILDAGRRARRLLRQAGNEEEEVLFAAIRNDSPSFPAGTANAAARSRA